MDQGLTPSGPPSKKKCTCLAKSTITMWFFFYQQQSIDQSIKFVSFFFYFQSPAYLDSKIESVTAIMEKAKTNPIL